MKIPYLRKKTEIKSCHNVTWEDDYSWIHQKNILEVLQDKKKLNPEVEKYLNLENQYCEHQLKDTKNIQKELFDEIKGRVKLDDESLPFKDRAYEYWTKTTAKGNYSIKLRKKINTNKIEEIWNGDKEKTKLNVEKVPCTFSIWAPEGVPRAQKAAKAQNLATIFLWFFHLFSCPSWLLCILAAVS